MPKTKPKIRKVTLPDGKVITVIEAPSRKYRPLPPNLPKYAPPRLASVRSPLPIAHINFAGWGKLKKKSEGSSTN